MGRQIREDNAADIEEKQKQREIREKQVSQWCTCTMSGI